MPNIYDDELTDSISYLIYKEGVIKKDEDGHNYVSKEWLDSNFVNLVKEKIGIDITWNAVKEKDNKIYSIDFDKNAKN